MEPGSLRPLAPPHLDAAEALLDELLAGRLQSRLGQRQDVLALPGAGAWERDRLIGLVTWGKADGHGRAELAALAVAASHQGQGWGGTLVEVAAETARVTGAAVQWLVTTNDNLDALRLYQRHGYRMVALRAGAVDASRRTKPTIPATGHYGIPLRDELILERRL